jgi:hypothetical protein
MSNLAATDVQNPEAHQHAHRLIRTSVSRVRTRLANGSNNETGLFIHTNVGVGSYTLMAIPPEAALYKRLAN